MEPANIRFGGGSSATVLHPIVAVAMALTIILILCLPRKYAIIPLLLTIFFTPKGQVVVLAGVHFTIARILFLTGLVRRATSRQSSSPAAQLNAIDRVFIPWAVSFTVIVSLRYLQTQALIKSLGDFLDVMGGYFVIRFLVQDREDVRRTIKVFALIAAVMAIPMINEQRTGQNVFGILGGIARNCDVRNGAIRSQGAFEHSILAGTYGATLIPLLVALWSDAKRRVLSTLGVFGATVMTVTCHASTTLLAYVCGMSALCLWPLRKKMRLVRWGLVVTLLALHLVMHGPVWSLIEKIDLTGSSSSYHRYMLVDNCIRHFGDWWLLGAKDYDKWGFDMWDMSDQYVAYAVAGGLVTFAFFIAIISKGFGLVGTARKRVEGNRREEWFLWCLGAALFAHVVSYFGIGYFDQMQFAWFALLAIICAAASEAMHASVPEAQEALALPCEAGVP